MFATPLTSHADRLDVMNHRRLAYVGVLRVGKKGILIFISSDASVLENLLAYRNLT